MQIHSHIPELEEMLAPWRETLGRDYLAYRNHLYRLLHYAFYLALPEEEARQKLIIAACFHDLGIWSDETLDYLPPSVELFRLCDRIDLSWGLIRSGVSAHFIERVKQSFPNAGFHRRLGYFGWVYFKRHPFNPLPMFRW